MPGLYETLKALYYNKSQAVAVLGIKPDRFDEWVREGLITPFALPGYKRPYYAKAEVDAFAKRLMEQVTQFGKIS